MKDVIGDDARSDVNGKGPGKKGTFLRATSALTLLARALLAINLNLDTGTKRNVMQSNKIDSKQERTG